jgi:hypothetical protein
VRLVINHPRKNSKQVAVSVAVSLAIIADKAPQKRRIASLADHRQVSTSPAHR